MLNRLLLSFALVLTVVSANVGVASAQSGTQRIALVIGNGRYEAVDPLPNAPRDANLVATHLRRLAFEVEEYPNLPSERLSAVIAAYGQRLKAAGPNVVSFFYYAGHAAQDSTGVNYLVPVDATARSPAELRAQATPLQALFDDMTEANNAVNVMVLDACRDWYRGERNRSQIAVRGLRDMGRHGNVFIALATSPNTTSGEGGGDNSPYTTRLAEALQTKANQPLSLLFDDVNASVYSDTDAGQSPEFLNGLNRAPRFCLVNGPGCGSAAVRPGALVLTNDYLRGLDRAKLLAFTRDNVTFVDTLLSRRDLLAANGIDSPLRLAHFLAAVAFETGSFRAQSERFTYTTETLERVFGNRFEGADLAQYVGQPERIASRAYANRMGNGDEASGDGWRYRGRGLFMLTGRNNYTQASQWIGVDLVANPDLLSDPEINLAAAVAFWNRRGLNTPADADDINAIARAIAGRSSFVERRQALVTSAKAAVAPP